MTAASLPANGQESVPDFRSNGYSAPVHVPPRVPQMDPGLPKTLNGKFNSTQDIRSSRSSGLQTNLSDWQQAGANRFNTRQQPAGNQFAARPQPQQQRQIRQPRPQRQQPQQRVGTGLQGRIGNLVSSNKSNKQQARKAERVVRSTPPAPVINRQSIRPQEVNPYSNTIPSNTQFVATGTGVANGEQLPQARVAPVQQQSRPVAQTNSRQRDVRRTEQVAARQRQSTNRPSRTNQVRRTEPRLPEPRLPEQPRYAQTQSIEPIGEPVEAFEEIDDRYVRYSNEPQEKFTNPFPPKPAELAPRDAARQFKQNLGARKVAARSQQLQVQSQLPASQNLDQQQIEAISVLSDSNDSAALSLEPGAEFNSSPSDIPDSYDPVPQSPVPQSGPFYETGSNVLRTPVVLQEEPEAPENLDEDNDIDDTDFDYEDPVDDSRPSPLRKSCDEFRFELLDNKPITDIALDISPPAKTDLLGANVYRVWRDQYGNELAQGNILDLRRGYLIVGTGGGGQVRLPYARLSDADWLAISDYWRLPIECGLGQGVYNHRAWTPQTVTWHASSLCHKPLYFENIQLERYGHSHGPVVQPFASTVHFFGKLFFLPYNTAINPPNECQYALGFYRPGNCAPWLREPFPISLQGFARQTAFYTGFGFLVD